MFTPKNVHSSYGNSQFMASIMDALDQLKGDEFIDLFLKAENESVYKVAKGKKDPHTALLFEIVQNIYKMDFQRDHGELILQALYAAPAVSELSKVTAMLAVGATLEYEEFKRRFGKGGDFELNTKKNRTYPYKHELEIAQFAFDHGLNQSEDIRFLIDKFKIIQKAFTVDATQDFFHSLMRYDFTTESFIELLESFHEFQRPGLMDFAPDSVFTSERALEFFDRGYINPYGNMNPILDTAFEAGNAALVTKAAAIALERRDAGHDQLDHFIARMDSEKLTDAQVAIKKDLIEQINAHELDVSKTQSITFHSSAPLYLIRAFDLGNLDHFTKILKATNEETYGREIFMPVFMAIVNGKSGFEVNEDHLKMVALLKERIFERVSSLADSVTIGVKAPEINRYSYQRNMQDDGFGPGH